MQIQLQTAQDTYPLVLAQIETAIRQLLPDSKPRVWVETPSTSLELRFLGAPKIYLDGSERSLRYRFYELLCLMALHPGGLTSEQMSLCLFGEEGNSGACRIELGRLRQLIPFESRPYRLLDLSADFMGLRECLYRGEVGAALELYRGPLLPYSQAPAIVDARLDLEEALRRAVIISRNPDHLWKLAEKLKDDLEVWQIARDYLGELDPRKPLAEARCKRITGEWKLDVEA
jgi:hypothetical protein